jgi:hypothetical protein
VEGPITDTNRNTVEGVSTFRPIPEIATPTANGSLMFVLTNDIPFLGEVNDDCFSAHKFYGNTTDLGREANAGLYFRDDPARVLWCLERYQFCNPTLSKDTGCTRLTSAASAEALADSLWRSDTQRLLFEWSRRASVTGISGMPSWLRDLSLLSRQSLSATYQAHLPDNQWELEIEY